MFGLNKYKYTDLGKITFLLMVDLVETPNNELYNQFIMTNINDFVVQHLHVYIAMERMWAHLIFTRGPGPRCNHGMSWCYHGETVLNGICNTYVLISINSNIIQVYLLFSSLDRTIHN